MIKLLSLTLVFAILTWVICLNVAHAGCVGGSIGDACIGIPTPSPPPYSVQEYREPPVVVEPGSPVIVEHHHHHDGPPVIIERHNDDDED
jgi:hypothetical protein